MDTKRLDIDAPLPSARSRDDASKSRSLGYASSVDSLDGDDAALDINAPLPSARTRHAAVKAHLSRYTSDTDSMDDGEIISVDAPLPSSRGRGGKEHQRLRDQLLRRRVLTIDEYARELENAKLAASERERRHGSGIVPIPVALAVSESEEQYEERFLKWLRARAVSLEELKDDPNRERSFRISYALNVAKKAMPSVKDTAPRNFEDSDSKSSKDNHDESVKRSRQLMLVHEYMDLEEYRHDSRQGRFKKLGRMNWSERHKMFGSGYSLIYVPLARGESKELYEEHFVRWLMRKHGMTLQELVDHPVQIHERYMRMQFAAASAKGVEKFIPPPEVKRARDDGEQSDDIQPSPAKVAKHECSGKDTTRERLQCGCLRCLVSGIQQLAEQISGMEHKLHQRAADQGEELQPSAIVDLTLDRTEEHNDPELDPFEQQLFDEYNVANEQIVMNERVLEASAAQLASEPIVDIEVTTQLQDENQEMYDLIRGEFAGRNVSLAILIVWMWRNEVVDLEKMIDAKSASDVPHIQRRCHHQIADLAAHITNANSTPPARERIRTDPNKSRLVSELISTRKGLFMTLLHFDAQLREIVRAILARI